MKYEWTKMTPRERDALVATHVMRWTRCSEFAGDWHGQPPFVRGTVAIPNYTTDIAAAWEVVEKLKHTDAWEYGHFDLRWGGYGKSLTPKGPCGQMMYPNELAWCCVIEMTTTTGMGVAPTAPEAICMAALRAMGVDVE